MQLTKTESQIVRAAIALVLASIAWRLTKSGALRLGGNLRVAAALAVGALAWAGMALYEKYGFDGLIKPKKKSVVGGAAAVGASGSCGDTCLGVTY